MSSPSCTLEECASALGISVRTLQKQLARMDASFSSVLEAEKQAVAKAALAHSRVSLDELAFQLGYGEQTTFGRAFRRWTGMSPGEFRRHARKTTGWASNRLSSYTGSASDEETSAPARNSRQRARGEQQNISKAATHTSDG